MKDYIVHTNSQWERKTTVRLSIVTAIYNRVDLFKRTIESVLRQTSTSFEYIIVDDGSSDDVFTLVSTYMNRTTIPFLFIKKENGGAHTARNLGIRQARGEYLLILDADDELVNDAVDTYLRAWDSIPEHRRGEYREVVARNMDEYGRLLSIPFPEGINNMPKDIAQKKAQTGAHISVNRTDVLRNNPFDEPQGVTFVDENLLWIKLDRLYKSYYINDVTYIYHMDIDDSICHSKGKKKTVQHCINSLYNSRCYLELNKSFSLRYFKRVLMYTTFLHVLRILKETPSYSWNTKHIKGVINRMLIPIAWAPCYFMALEYIKNKM